jgi:hypothetical protein
MFQGLLFTTFLLFSAQLLAMDNADSDVALRTNVINAWIDFKLINDACQRYIRDPRQLLEYEVLLGYAGIEINSLDNLSRARTYCEAINAFIAGYTCGITQESYEKLRNEVDGAYIFIRDHALGSLSAEMNSINLSTLPMNINQEINS